MRYKKKYEMSKIYTISSSISKSVRYHFSRLKSFNNMYGVAFNPKLFLLSNKIYFYKHKSIHFLNCT